MEELEPVARRKFNLPLYSALTARLLRDDASEYVYGADIDTDGYDLMVVVMLTATPSPCLDMLVLESKHFLLDRTSYYLFRETSTGKYAVPWSPNIFSYLFKKRSSDMLTGETGNALLNSIYSLTGDKDKRLLNLSGRCDDKRYKMADPKYEHRELVYMIEKFKPTLMVHDLTVLSKPPMVSVPLVELPLSESPFIKMRDSCSRYAFSPGNEDCLLPCVYLENDYCLGRCITNGVFHSATDVDLISAKVAKTDKNEEMAAVYMSVSSVEGSNETATDLVEKIAWAKAKAGFVYTAEVVDMIRYVSHSIDSSLDVILAKLQHIPAGDSSVFTLPDKIDEDYFDVVYVFAVPINIVGNAHLEITLMGDDTVDGDITIAPNALLGKLKDRCSCINSRNIDAIAVHFGMMAYYYISTRQMLNTKYRSFKVQSSDPISAAKFVVNDSIRYVLAARNVNFEPCVASTCVGAHVARQYNRILHTIDCTLDVNAMPYHPIRVFNAESPISSVVTPSGVKNIKFKHLIKWVVARYADFSLQGWKSKNDDLFGLKICDGTYTHGGSQPHLSYLDREDDDRELLNFSKLIYGATVFDLLLHQGYFNSAGNVYGRNNERFVNFRGAYYVPIFLKYKSVAPEANSYHAALMSICRS